MFRILSFAMLALLPAHGQGVQTSSGVGSTVTGVTIPATSAPLCGNGSANSVKPCAAGTDYATAAAATQAAAAAMTAQHQAGAVSPLDGTAPLVCDAVATYTVQPNAMSTSVELIGVTVKGTDNTAAWAAYLNSLGSGVYTTDSAHVPVVPIGLSIEGPQIAHGNTPGGAGGTAPQNTARLPNNCHLMISDSPDLPEGIDFEGNGSDIYLVNANPTLTTGAIKSIDRAANEANGRTNTVLNNVTVTCGGSWTYTSQTYAGVYVEANQVKMHNVNVFNCPIGYAESVSEYSTHEGISVGHNRVGIYLAPGPATIYGQPTNGTDTPGYPYANGGPEIDNTWIGTSARNNAINIWGESSLSQQFIGGTLSYAYVMPVLLGNVYPHWIDAVAVGAPASGAVACTASAAIPVATTDSTGTQAEVMLYTNASGVPTRALSLKGGYNYSSSPTLTVPATGAASCSNPPVLTAHVMSMDTWGMFTAPAGSVGAYQTVFKNFDIEAFSQGGHPSTGLIFYGDKNSAQNTVEQNNILNDGTYTSHIAQFDGPGNFVAHNRGEAMTDPWDGTQCPYLLGNTGTLQADILASSIDPSLAMCYANNKAYANNYTAPYTGFDGPYLVSNGLETETSNGYNSFFRSYLRDGVTGAKEAFPRYAVGVNSVLFGGGSAAPDFGINRNGPGTGGITGTLNNLPVNYNGGFVGTNILSNTGDVLTWYYRNNGSGGFFISEAGQQTSNDGSLHTVHLTCAPYTPPSGTTVPPASYVPTGCVKDADSGQGGIVAPGYTETLTTPASSSAPCNAGQFTDDANYHYVCVRSGVWKRVALSAF